MRYPILLSTLALTMGIISCNNVNDDPPPKNPSHNNTTPQENNLCGNNQLNYQEECDGDNFGNNTCKNAGLGYTGGVLKCNKDCTIDYSECSSRIPDGCGDNRVTKKEECDGDNLNGKTCESFPGYSGGTLSCFETCQFDKRNCIPEKIDDGDDYEGEGEITNTTCIGPEKYTVGEIADGQPCNFDSDCGGNLSHCYQLGFQIGICGGTTIPIQTAVDDYWINGAEVDDYMPCNLDDDCIGENSYCYLGIDTRVCLPRCKKGDRATAPYLCEKVFGYSDTDYGCTLNAGGLGKNGDECNSTDFDCRLNYKCHKNICSSPCMNSSECGAGFSCQTAIQTGKGYCLSNSLLGKTQLDKACISSAECASGLICSYQNVCVKNPTYVSSNYHVSNIEDGHACNNNFDCKSGICSQYLYQNVNIQGTYYDYVCGQNSQTIYDDYFNSEGTSKLGEPCNYDEDCDGYEEFDPSTGNLCWFADYETSTESMCVQVCDPFFPDCPAGYTCITNDFGENLCAPNRGTGTSGASCKMTYWDCAEGYFCDTNSFTCLEF